MNLSYICRLHAHVEMCQTERVIPYRPRLSSTPPAMWVEMFISVRPYRKCPLRMDNEILVQRCYFVSGGFYISCVLLWAIIPFVKIYLN